MRTARAVRVDIGLRPGQFRWALAVLLLSAGARPLGSEEVTLTTYYPSPSGLYTRMIATGQTVLARDRGAVGVGTVRPAYKLDVVSAQSISARFQGGASNRAQIAVDSDANRQSAILFSDRGSPSWQLGRQADGTLFLYGFAVGRDVLESTPSGDVALQPAVGRVGIQNGSPGSALDVGGNGIVVSRQPAAQCRSVDYAAGVTSACAVGEYATSQRGVYSRVAWMRNGGSVLCCACPAGNCPGLP